MVILAFDPKVRVHLPHHVVKLDIGTLVVSRDAINNFDVSIAFLSFKLHLFLRFLWSWCYLVTRKRFCFIDVLVFNFVAYIESLVSTCRLVFILNLLVVCVLFLSFFG